MIYVFLMLISAIVFLAFVSRIEQLSGRIKSLESEKKSLEDKLLWAEPQFIVTPQPRLIDTRAKAIEATAVKLISRWQKIEENTNPFMLPAEPRFFVRNKIGNRHGVIYAGIGGIRLKGEEIRFFTWEEFYESYPDECEGAGTEQEVLLPISQYEELKKSHETLISLYSEINSLKIPTDEELQERIQT